VVLGPNTDQLGPRSRYDGCHFNAQGRARIVEETLAVILPLLRREAR
jgi:lysophospholipase L1-like esterase